MLSIASLQLCNPCLKSLNLAELNSIRVNHQDSIVQPSQGKKLVIVKVAAAQVDGVLVRDD